ncbi:zinc-dependent alcohol dehydrogenase [Actinosynnema pretiosum]|uniref:L-iditol 2-dehydrogenase n=1 Tax=Actinosynnema pretiosum TaxID=42197 RepID=A0A290Z6S4_9PSEU|nr:alcohol dehydrogenase catalytic domain-containing protein [Actinosynnema pretiosum]ATE54751.1 L-iditol 2-dehydrogenase [Actinosynnema pretiosum]
MAAGTTAPTTMGASVLTAERVVEHRRVPVPALGADGVLVRVLATGICGSDLSTYRGLHPYKRPPVVLGHEFCGRVEALGQDGGAAAGVSVGDLVCSSAYRPCGDCAPCRAGTTNLCQARDNLSHRGWDGSFAEYVLLRPGMVFRLPDDLDHELGALVEPLSIGLHAVRRAVGGRAAVAGPPVPPGSPAAPGAAVAAGASLTVLGGGSIGLACALAARRLGFDPIACVDLGPRKGELARAVGVDHYADARRGDAAKAVLAALPGGGDVTVVASGHPTALADAAGITRPGGQVVVVTYFDGPQELDWNALVGAELTVRTSALSTAADFTEVIGWLTRGEVDPSPLVTHRFPLRAAADALAALDSGAGEVGKVILRARTEDG